VLSRDFFFMSIRRMALSVYLAPNVNEGIKLRKMIMGGECSTFGRDAKYKQNYGQKISIRDHLVYLVLDKSNSDNHYSQSLQIQIHE
jgi:hypothetical protein